MATICRAYGHWAWWITETTFYRWRKTYSDMATADVLHLREVTRERSAHAAAGRAGFGVGCDPVYCSQESWEAV